MRIALAVVLGLVTNVAAGCSKEPEQPVACAELYALIDKLESCTALPDSIGKNGMALKRKGIDILLRSAKKQGDHEGLCRNEATILRKSYEMLAPSCLK